MRRARDAPAEAALDRADVDDRLRAAVARSPGRPPRSGSTRRTASSTSRMRRIEFRSRRPSLKAVWMKSPWTRIAQPERAEVAEHDLALGRLAEQAHVRDAAVRDEVARAGRVAAVLRALRVALLRLLDLAADGRDQHVAAQPHARVLQRAHRLDVAGERALHVRDPEPVEPAVALERLRLEAGDVAQPRLAARVRRVHVAVEHQRRAAAGARPGAERVRAPLLDLLPLHLEAERS